MIENPDVVDVYTNF